MEQNFWFKMLAFNHIMFLTSRLTSDFGVKNLVKTLIFWQFVSFFMIFSEKTSKNEAKMCL
jgi:hypothetical protein